MDDDDKIRRNLVICSVAIITTQAIGLRINHTELKLLDSFIVIPAIKTNVVWLLLLILTTYFLLRFVYSVISSELFNSLKADIFSARKTIILECFKEQITNGKLKDFEDAGRESNVSSLTKIDLTEIAGILSKALNQSQHVVVDTASNLIPLVSPIYIRSIITISIRENNAENSPSEVINTRYPAISAISEWHQTVDKFGNRHQTYIGEYSRNVCFGFTPLEILKLNLKAIWNVAWSKQHGIQIFFPIIMAIMALLTCVIGFCKNTETPTWLVKIIA